MLNIKNLDEPCQYMEAMHVGDGFHPTQKTFDGKALRDQGPTTINLQTLHFQVSISYSNAFHNHLLFPHLPTNCAGNIKHFIGLPISCVECMFHLRISIFSVGLTTSIGIIRHNGIGILDFFFGDILWISKILMVLNFV